MSRPPVRRLRRRLDNLALRWHARLDSDWSDRSLPGIMAGAGFVVLSGLAVAGVRMLEAGDDLAIYTQAAWLIGRGERAHLTLVDADLLDVQGSFVLYPLGLLARLPVPLAELRLVLQSAALALAVVPLWRLARRPGPHVALRHALVVGWPRRGRSGPPRGGRPGGRRRRRGRHPPAGGAGGRTTGVAAVPVGPHGPPRRRHLLVDQADLRQGGLALPVAAPPGFFERSRDQGVVTYRRAP